MAADVDDVLARAVASFGGQRRSGQVEMAQRISTALEDNQHLLVQAGTGTGKSLAYLIPSFLQNQRVVIATATLNLQHQLMQRDIPALKTAVSFSGHAEHAVVKGRANYACLHRVRDVDVEDTAEGQESLLPVQGSSVGDDVVRLRGWAEAQVENSGSGDRDDAPAHVDAAWRQVSVSARECIGAIRCPYASECFAERAREHAEDAQVVITNHALLAIDAIDDVPMLPDYQAVIVDEAHELVARVTQAKTEELSPASVERASRNARRYLEDRQADDLIEATEACAEAVEMIAVGRVDTMPASLRNALELVRDGARACLSALAKRSENNDGDTAVQQAHAMVDQIRSTADRMARLSPSDVLWVSEFNRDRQLQIAPIDVSDSLHDKLFSQKTVVLTSATLKLGGRFEPMATSLGLTRQPDDSWSAVDVGSPFDYRKQAILYVAQQLPSPGRDGLQDSHLREISALITAAGGRTLGLFSSRRAAEAASEYVREHLDGIDVWCQGDAQLSELAKRFMEHPGACLFGTLSLWQGLDIPGDTCQLVIIDRIPFPRPDDPVMSARAQRVAEQGGNGFMQVSATHAALLLAQGSGRLIRRHEDRGVVAILDSRLVSARYGTFLLESLPPMWRTTDTSTVLDALGRLNEAGSQPVGV